MSNTRRCIRPFLHGKSGLVLLLAACGDDKERAPYATRRVVAEAIATLEREVEGQPAHEETSPADLKERVEELVQVAAHGDRELGDLACAEAPSLGSGAVAALLPWVDDEEHDPTERAAAVRLLGALDSPEAAEKLLERLEFTAPAWLRAQCAWRIGETSQDWTVPALILRLKYETDAQTVIWLASSLQRFGNCSGIDGLEQLSASAPNEQDRAAAAGVLASWAQAYGLSSPTLVRGEWHAGRLPEPVASPRLSLQVWREIQKLAEWQLRGVDDARFVLARMGASAAECLAQALLDQDVYVRVHAAQCLERMGPRALESSAALIEALDDPHLAPQAALALGAINAEQAVPFLSAALDRENPFDLRLAAAWALAKLAKSEAAPSLAPLLAEEEPADLRGAAAAALLRCGDPPVRARAMQVLGQLLSAENLERSPLERALEEELARSETEIARRWRDLADLPDLERLQARAELVLAHSAELAGASRTE